ncbi:hypothetical protein [Methanosarcina barkeri]|uniref:hypothetical protein n=1 Tax=Methanosarcina barkeri TaxID=2208 RepID=UPI0018B0C7FE|nr:hypothetical protein [Methanosarcina barkeri]
MPGLGKLSAQLYESSHDAYSLLYSNGHIERMRNIEQLGVIHNVYEGVHHSRWEYVMTQLGLLHRLYPSDKKMGGRPLEGWGLNSDIEFLDKKLSGLEVIQIWILLSNSGHLPGTFSSEKALMKYILKDVHIKEILRNSLHDYNVKLYFDSILETEDFYNFNKILSFFFLEQYRDKNPELIDFLIEILKFYCIGCDALTKDVTSEKKASLVKKRSNFLLIFNRLRQISYLYLDSLYGPVPFDFDLPSILVNLPDHINDLFIGDGDLIQTLNSFDSFLSNTIYQSEKSLQAHGYHVKNVTNITKNKSRKIIDRVDLYKFLMEDSNFEPLYTNFQKSQTIRFLLDIVPGYSKIYKRLFNFEMEDFLNKRYGITKCIFTLEPNIKKDTYMMSLSFSDKCTDTQSLIVLGKLMKDLIELKQKLTKENPFGVLEFNPFNLYIESMFERIFSQLILFFLKQIIESDYIYRYDNHDLSKVSCIGTVGSKDAAILLENYCENHENLPESRLHEVKSMIKVLNLIGYRGNIIVTCDQIKIFDIDRSMVTDLDGLAVGFSKNKFSVILIEAKKQRKRGQSSSIRQLKKNIDKLNLNTTVESNVEYIESYCAYSLRQIDGNKYSKLHR